MHWPVLFLSLLILVSCGKSNSNAGFPDGWDDVSPQAPATNEVTPQKNYYLARMVAINPETTGNVRGQLSLEQTGFTYKSRVSLSTATWHRDSIHMGTRCPTKADDINGDMIIDEAEANAVVGQKIVSLNSDSRMTNFTGNFAFNGKVVLITSSTEAMACGILRTVSSLPAEPNYEPEPRPEPLPEPRPEPQPEPEREDDEEEDSWTDRWNDWWRCRLGGCD